MVCVHDEGGEVLGDHDERINGNSNGTGDSGQEEVEIPTTQPTQVNQASVNGKSTF